MALSQNVPQSRAHTEWAKLLLRHSTRFDSLSKSDTHDKTTAGRTLINISIWIVLN